MRDKKWEVEFLGVLAKSDEIGDEIRKNAIFVNNNNTIQFFIKILSAEPDNFPKDVKFVTCYSEELENWGFEDDIYQAEWERRENCRSFLEPSLLTFKVETKIGTDMKEYHIAKSVHLKSKHETFNDHLHFNSLPIFNSQIHEISNRDFIERLKNNKFVGRNDQISKEEDDTPLAVFWKDEDQNLLAFGPFDKHQYAFGGFQFFSDEPIKSILFREEWFEESYIHENVIFISNEIYEKLLTDLNARGEELPGKQTSEETKFESNKELNVELYQELEPESLFIDEFERATREMHLYYSKKDLINFHTAIKSCSLTILAGMSGTGKSKIVQAYAKALGIGRDQLNIIPVRPSWNDDTDLIGYPDTLNMVYRPGDSGLVNTLIKAKNEPNKLFIISFDEMNLARVEHYFSQFLSVLENEENKRVLNLYNEELSNRLYNSSLYPSSIPIGDNVLFVGTVNIDESTYHFSDKVLDRANVISLDVLPFHYMLENFDERKKGSPGTDGPKYISKEDYHEFKQLHRNIDLNNDELTLLWDMHEMFQLEHHSLGIGPRVVKQIDRYIKNLPTQTVLERREAFDIQLVQRIFTKLRGSEELLLSLIGEYNTQTNEIENSALLKILNESSISLFNHSINVIERKAKELKVNGHTI